MFKVEHELVYKAVTIKSGAVLKVISIPAQPSGFVQCAAPGTFSAPACAVRTHLTSTAVRDDNPISYLNRTSEHFTGFSLLLKHRI